MKVTVKFGWTHLLEKGQTGCLGVGGDNYLIVTRLRHNRAMLVRVCSG